MMAPSGAIKLTRQQRLELRVIVATNGGGVHVDHIPERAFRRLRKLGLVQVKSRQPWMIVHTHEGWTLSHQLDTEAGHD